MILTQSGATAESGHWMDGWKVKSSPPIKPNKNRFTGIAKARREAKKRNNIRKGK